MSGSGIMCEPNNEITTVFMIRSPVRERRIRGCGREVPSERWPRAAAAGSRTAGRRDASWSPWCHGVVQQMMVPHPGSWQHRPMAGSRALGHGTGCGTMATPAGVHRIYTVTLFITAFLNKNINVHHEPIKARTRTDNGLPRQ